MLKIQPKSTCFVVVVFFLSAFTHLFNNYILSASYSPGTTLGAGIQERTKETKILPLVVFIILAINHSIPSNILISCMKLGQLLWPKLVLLEFNSFNKKFSYMKTNVSFVLTIWQHLGLVLFYYLSFSCFLEVYPELKNSFPPSWKDTSSTAYASLRDTGRMWRKRGPSQPYGPFNIGEKWNCLHIKFPREDIGKGCTELLLQLICNYCYYYHCPLTSHILEYLVLTITPWGTDEKTGWKM